MTSKTSAFLAEKLNSILDTVFIAIENNNTPIATRVELARLVRSQCHNTTLDCDRWLRVHDKENNAT